MWLTMVDIMALLRCKNAQIKKLKLAGLNMARSLLAHAHQIVGHKHFLIAVGEGKVVCMHTLVLTLQKADNSIYAILQKWDHAVCEVYHPMCYDEYDFQRVFLFHKLSGVAVAELAHRAFGLPSIEATRRHISTKPLVASPKMPTIGKMTQNLHHAFPPLPLSSTSHPRTGVFQLMADEIKLKIHMRWDPWTNMILSVDCMIKRSIWPLRSACFVTAQWFMQLNKILGHHSSGQHLLR
jgi:hypothetical protein